jgi:hypothetical protein
LREQRAFGATRPNGRRRKCGEAKARGCGPPGVPRHRNHPWVAQQLSTTTSMTHILMLWQTVDARTNK